MSVILVSKSLIVTFVTTVTMWYFVTPYIVQPHPGIVNDLLTRVRVNEYPAVASEYSKSNSQSRVVTSSSPRVRIENWTKWRLFVRNTDQVIHGGTSDLIAINNSKAVMYMDWRQDYEIFVLKPAIEDKAATAFLEARIEAPLTSFHRWGIYNHLAAEVLSSDVVRIVPRFLFGIPVSTIDQMYGGVTSFPVPDSDSERTLKFLSKLPIIGVFSASTRYDRLIIQAYMNLVTLSVIFLLWANNPPESLLKPSSNKNTSGNDGNESSDAVESTRNGHKNSCKKRRVSSQH